MLNVALTLFLTCFSLAFNTTHALSSMAQKSSGSSQTPDTYPADICFMVADLKYNSHDGVKICEIQQACLSLFNGDKFRNPHEESIHQEFLRVLSRYKHNKADGLKNGAIADDCPTDGLAINGEIIDGETIDGWIVANSMADRNLVATLATSSNWHTPRNIFALFSDQNFKQKACDLVRDRASISSYHGFLYINWSQLCAITDFETRFPGMLILDKASFPFWIDKYRMTELFSQDPALAACKPRWGNYKKVYTPELAEHIARDLDCETFVIKPRGEFLGNGVIITHRQDLDQILYYITTKTGPLATSKDPAFTSWQRDQFDSFIVEEFVSSDLITIPHLGNKTYQPTMRVAFVLVHDNGQHTVHFLGAYWKTPAVSLEEEEAHNFMSKNKDICKPPYYCAVDPKTLQAVYHQLSVALPILHRKMVHTYYDFPETKSAPTKRGAVQIVLQQLQQVDLT